MPEHMRVTSQSGDVYQWVDSDVWIVFDLKGYPVQAKAGFPTKEAALKYVRPFSEGNASGSLVIARLECIRAFLLPPP